MNNDNFLFERSAIQNLSFEDQFIIFRINGAHTLYIFQGKIFGLWFFSTEELKEFQTILESGNKLEPAGLDYLKRRLGSAKDINDFKELTSEYLNVTFFTLILERCSFCGHPFQIYHGWQFLAKIRKFSGVTSSSMKTSYVVEVKSCCSSQILARSSMRFT